MKITIPNSYIEREFEIKELKVLERINKLEFYLENKKIFLEKKEAKDRRKMEKC